MNKELDFAEGNETAFDTKTPLRLQLSVGLARPAGRYPDSKAQVCTDSVVSEFP